VKGPPSTSTPSARSCVIYSRCAGRRRATCSAESM
jgi:hypothetical protein